MSSESADSDGLSCPASCDSPPHRRDKIRDLWRQEDERIAALETSLGSIDFVYLSFPFFPLPLTDGLRCLTLNSFCLFRQCDETVTNVAADVSSDMWPNDNDTAEKRGILSFLVPVRYFP